jgi:hypothetical protein
MKQPIEHNHNILAISHLLAEITHLPLADITPHIPKIIHDLQNQRFQAAAARGIAEVERGETHPLTLTDMQQIKKNAMHKALHDEPYHNHDALPKDLNT